MKILVLTQKIDIKDSYLSFFHDWALELAKHFSFVTIICLSKGQYELPANTKVLSLGKEYKPSRLRYIWRFYRQIWRERKNYEAVLVHMNQEYILLGGLFWLILGKKIYMWRNHHAGSILTDLAALFCTKVFCTSKYSYTAKYKKTVLMPVGANTDLFQRKAEIQRQPLSILFFGRIAPVKRPDLLIEVLSGLKKSSQKFTASFYGDALPADASYHESLKKKVETEGLSDCVQFYLGSPNWGATQIYNSHEIFVNLSTSGMYDKTIFEAMACECLVLASNENLHGLIDEQFIFKEGNREDLAQKLLHLLHLDSDQKKYYGERLREIVVAKHSLQELGNRLKQALLGI